MGSTTDHPQLLLIHHTKGQGTKMSCASGSNYAIQRQQMLCLSVELLLTFPFSPFSAHVIANLTPLSEKFGQVLARSAGPYLVTLLAGSGSLALKEASAIAVGNISLVSAIPSLSL